MLLIPNSRRNTIYDCEQAFKHNYKAASESDYFNLLKKDSIVAHRE